MFQGISFDAQGRQETDFDLTDQHKAQRQKTKL